MTQTCAANSPLRCPIRADAMARKLCWYDYENHVWMWDWGGFPSPVTKCWGCDAPLPVMAQIVKRVIQNDTPWDATLGNPDE